jgi:hypothetical protein
MSEEENKKSAGKMLLRYFKLRHFIGIAVGLAGGFLYYRLVGCSSGACPITSNPWLTLMWGGVMGYLLADIFSFKKKKPAEEIQPPEAPKD